MGLIMNTIWRSGPQCRGKCKIRAANRTGFPVNVPPVRRQFANLGQHGQVGNLLKWYRHFQEKLKRHRNHVGMDSPAQIASSRWRSRTRAERCPLTNTSAANAREL
jgi:hypothetical protein